MSAVRIESPQIGLSLSVERSVIPVRADRISLPIGVVLFDGHRLAPDEPLLAERRRLESDDHRLLRPGNVRHGDPRRLRIRICGRIVRHGIYGYHARCRPQRIDRRFARKRRIFGTSIHAVTVCVRMFHGPPADPHFPGTDDFILQFGRGELHRGILRPVVAARRPCDGRAQEECPQKPVFHICKIRLCVFFRSREKAVSACVSN